MHALFCGDDFRHPRAPAARFFQRCQRTPEFEIGRLSLRLPRLARCQPCESLLRLLKARVALDEDKVSGRGSLEQARLFIAQGLDQFPRLSGLQRGKRLTQSGLHGRQVEVRGIFGLHRVDDGAGFANLSSRQE